MNVEMEIIYERGWGWGWEIMYALVAIEKINHL